MQIAWFVILSAIYVTSLAIVDGLFNRLIFREYCALPYESKEKESIYQLPQWRYIGIIFLIVLPIILPLCASYLIGGWQYVCIYTIVLLIIQWDVIFGKLVFDDWWGDTPSIPLPHLGWLSFPLRLTIIARLALAALTATVVTYL